MWRYWEVVDTNGVIVAAGMDGSNEKDIDAEPPEDEISQVNDQKEE